MKDLKSLLAEKFKDIEFEKKFHGINSFFRLADEVLLLRKKRKITQHDLAEKMGTTQTVVSRLENATVMPTLETILKLAEALDAVVDIRLIPSEEINKEFDETVPDITQKEQNAIDGIVYFHADRTSETSSKWVDADKFSSILSISGKPSLAPIKRSKKNREFA